LKSGRSGNRDNIRASNHGTADEIQIAGQRIKRNALVKALRELDHNGDGQLGRAEVPPKHLRVFDALDSNGDNVVTATEVKAAIR